MRITIFAPTLGTLAGGLVTCYQHANHLARRGHEVHVVHLVRWDEVDMPLERSSSWFGFDDEVHQHWCHLTSWPPTPDQVDLEPWPSDVAFGAGVFPFLQRWGLPVSLVLGWTHLWSSEVDALHGPVVCVAQWVVDDLLRAGFDPVRLWRVNDGVDHSVFHPRAPVAGRPRRVASVSSPWEAKGTALAIEAVALAREEFPDLELVLFGWTGDEELPDWVRHLGRLDHEQLATEVYSRSSVYLCASAREGLGNVSIESIACGAALVTTDTGGSRDIVEHGVTGRVAASRSAEDLARELLVLLRDDEERIAMAERGRRRALEFRWEAGAELLEAKLLEYLADPPRFGTPR